MADLTDAELDALEADIQQVEQAANGPMSVIVDSPEILSLIAEVRRWRDQAADEAGLARLAAEIGRLAESVDHLGRKGPGGVAGFGEMDAPPGWIMPSVGSPGGATAAKEDGDE